MKRPPAPARNEAGPRRPLRPARRLTRGLYIQSVGWATGGSGPADRGGDAKGRLAGPSLQLSGDSSAART